MSLEVEFDPHAILIPPKWYINKFGNDAFVTISGLDQHLIARFGWIPSWGYCELTPQGGSVTQMVMEITPKYAIIAMKDKSRYSTRRIQVRIDNENGVQLRVDNKPQLPERAIDHVRQFISEYNSLQFIPTRVMLLLRRYLQNDVIAGLTSLIAGDDFMHGFTWCGSANLFEHKRGYYRTELLVNDKTELFRINIVELNPASGFPTVFTAGVGIERVNIVQLRHVRKGDHGDPIIISCVVGGDVGVGGDSASGSTTTPPEQNYSCFRNQKYSYDIGMTAIRASLSQDFVQYANEIAVQLESILSDHKYNWFNAIISMTYFLKTGRSS